MLERHQIRQDARARRRALSADTQHQAACSLALQLQQLACFTNAQHLALYLAQDGEIDPVFVIESCFAQNKAVYLPVIDAGRQGAALTFARYQPNTPMRANAFGILEPVNAPIIAAWELDLVLLPLVAFDAQGQRLGMGGGFYDRTFAPACLAAHTLTPPTLIGLAHDCQQYPSLDSESWDVPLDLIITPSRCIYPDVSAKSNE